MIKKLLVGSFLSFAAIANAQNSITSTSTVAGTATTYTFNLVAGAGGETWNAVSAYVVPGSTLPAFTANASPANVANVDVFLNGSNTETAAYLRNFGSELKIDIEQALPQGTAIKVVIKNVMNPSAAASNQPASIAFQNGNYSNLNNFSTAFNITSATLSTHEVNADSHKIQLYPNPSADFIRLSNFKANEVCSIYDLQGKLVLKQVYDQNKGVDITALSDGLYILKTAQHAYKFVKKSK